jgi:ribosomal protein S18 acetylase RimI-like enzyme
VGSEPLSTQQALLDAASRLFQTRGVGMAQVLLRQGSETEEQSLRQGGFYRLAQLLYLVSLDRDFPRSPPQTTISFRPYRPAEYSRLVQLVQSTYEQTLDCPGLNGIRDVEDVLAGYRSGGAFDADLWLIASHANSDVGCLLLTGHDAEAAGELSYMGIVPAARGHGWGQQMARYAQWLMRKRNYSRLVLAVDAANGPAVRMYAGAGFQVWDQRIVYVKIFP